MYINWEVYKITQIFVNTISQKELHAW